MFESKLESNNSSSTSSLNDSTNLKSNNFLLANCCFFKEEILNFSPESCDSNEFDKESMQSFLVTNVNYEKSDQHAFMIGLNGEIFFFKYSTAPIRKPIWHKKLNSIVLKYFKCDIDVIFQL